MVQVLYSAANETALNAAIAAIDAGSVLTTYTIDVTAGFTLTTGLTPISLASGKVLIVNGGGFTIVEALSNCPVGWGMTAQESLEHLKGPVAQAYPLGVIVDRAASAARPAAQAPGPAAPTAEEA